MKDLFVIEMRYVGEVAGVDELMDAHRAFLDRHYAAGTLLASGPKVPRSGGIILARGNSLEEIEALVAEDPFQQLDCLAYSITRFTPTKMADGFPG